jgi:hypothetical protein
MGNPPQAGLNAPQYDRSGVFEKAPDEVGVDDGGPVWTPIIDSTGGVVILFPFFFRAV